MSPPARPPAACPTEDELARFAEGQSEGPERQAIQEHLDGCADCRLVVASVVSQGRATEATRPEHDALGPTVHAGEAAGPAGPAMSLSRGTPVGRYVLLDRLGAGGMGTVYAAYDPVLDRRVALKLLRPDVFGPDGQDVLLREAKVLASFGHPNVLTVHDSGTFGDRVFLAMELVDGGTLRDWSRERTRSWREVVEMMGAVGEGLAAAHRAGVIHRDFKPENVLVGNDGRPRITDFGLAVRTGTSGDDASASGLGTPHYMAPEQMRGETPDARTDIFAFAVTLHLLLYGVRPFEGRGVEEINTSILANAVVEPPRDRRIPAWLRSLVLRGLRATPAERPASMDEVLAALRSDPGRRRGRVLGAVALALLALGLGVLGSRVAARRAQSCAAEGTVPESAWSAARRKAIEEAFTRTSLPYARASFEAVAHAIDAYADAWSAMRVSACEATRVRREQPEETLALRHVCLDDRARELAALASVLASADKDAVKRAPTAANALTPLSSCADVRTLAIPMPRPRDPEARRRLEAALARVDEANALMRTGKARLGYETAKSAVEELRHLGHDPSTAHAESVAATAAQRAGKPDEGVLHAREALVLAQQGRDELRVLDALDSLTQLNGVFLGRTEEGLFWSRLAFATVERIQASPHEVIAARSRRSLVLSAAGRLDEALADGREVVAGWTREYGPTHLSTIEARSNLGVVLFAMGRVAEAQAEFQAAVKGLETSLGKGNPEILPALSNLGVTLMTLGRLDEAAAAIEAVMAQSEAAFGPQGGYHGVALINAGELRIAQRRFDEALEIERKAISILEARGMDPSALCEPLTQVALAELGAGRVASALDPVERALQIGKDKSIPPVEMAKVQFAAARVLEAAGRDRERVRSLAGSARDAWADAARRFGGENQQRVDEINAFLATLRQ